MAFDIYDHEELVFVKPVRVWLEDGLAVYPTDAQIEEARIEFVTEMRLRRERLHLV